ncbi:NUDIX hydrolase [Yersinia intermedia]|uniref:NUDIX hydrolase n=1 Tax=Yersinia intermedia TaxID=631 RepID=UPI0022447D51|nr:NUDIX domain-containing protein [Yersinia intermedia]MCW8114087.1 NUDIX domain-containing protein [Yersinia intermedia]MDA5518862.1 NUDIX domain-containing protein [Yersinia intermedia]
MLREGVKHFTASAIILDENDRILMHFHKKLQMWLYPGGHIEENEEPQEALLREMLEEIGVTPEIMSCQMQGNTSLDLDPTSVTELPVPLTILCEKILEKMGGWHWHLDMIYLCILPADLIDAKGEFKWMTISEIEELPTPREFPSLIRRAVSVKKSYSNI